MENTQSLNFTVGRWTRATFLGWLLGVILILILSSFLDSIGIEGMQFYLGVGMGAGVGITQWWSLKRTIPVRKNWIWFLVAGMSIPFIIIDLLPAEMLPHKLPWSIALGGLTAGLLQRSILKDYSPSANRWIVASVVGWSLAVLTVFAVDYTRLITTLNWALAIINLFLILAGGIVLGLVTGIFLRRMLNA